MKDNLTVPIRRLALALALAVLLTAVVPVTAQAAESNDSGWIELLEYSSVWDNGENWFTTGQTGSVTIPLHGEKRLRRLDMLIWNPSGQRFTGASVTNGSSKMSLEVLAIGGNLTRVVGYIPNAWYEKITVDFTKATTSSQTYEVLSCKVTPVGVQEFLADASVYCNGGTYGISEPFNLDGAGTVNAATEYQIRIDVKDWQKYDSLSIWGSMADGSIESVRASVGTTALSISYNFFQQNESGGITDVLSNINTEIYTPYYGKYLYSLEIDLSNTDRTLTDPLYIYLTGHYNNASYATFNCQYVNGSVFTADTSEVTWWHRFTAFFSDLLGAEDSGGEDYAAEMESQAADMEDAVDQMDQVSRPPVDDLDVSIDAYIDPKGMAQVGNIVGGLMNNSMVMSMVMISMVLALAAYVIFGKR